MFNKLISFCLEIFFPKHCLGCQKSGTYLCQDCIACLDLLRDQYCLCKKPLIFSGKCHQCKTKNLDGLYSGLSYQRNLVKKIIHSFKYEPFIKELSQPLAFLIIEHFYLLEKQPSFFIDKTNFILIPIPMYLKRLKWRGFNQAEEIAKELSKLLSIPIIFNCLIKTKETQPQTELNHDERKENIKGVFLIKNREKIKDKEILLIDDVYTTGSTMEEAAKRLKRAGAKTVIGITIARG